jgi:hypothetical protein
MLSVDAASMACPFLNNKPTPLGCFELHYMRETLCKAGFGEFFKLLFADLETMCAALSESVT